MYMSMILNVESVDLISNEWSESYCIIRLNVAEPSWTIRLRVVGPSSTMRLSKEGRTLLENGI